ncbi:MAG: hypothetical protein L6264_07035 [Weeksellaceae bacterium]|nr:hypothetical protein [Bacteroidota bacterium]MCG2780686.1 hypothetical protein [Weeksellaceae bacterium]
MAFYFEVLKLTWEIFALIKIDISSLSIHSTGSQRKNPHCLSGSSKLNFTKSFSFRPSFGDFHGRNINFLAKRSSLELFVTFCFKQKVKKNGLRIHQIAVFKHIKEERGRLLSFNRNTYSNHFKQLILYTFSDSNQKR